jgi:hypothetical protein
MAVEMGHRLWLMGKYGIRAVIAYWRSVEAKLCRLDRGCASIVRISSAIDSPRWTAIKRSA